VALTKIMNRIVVSPPLRSLASGGRNPWLYRHVERRQPESTSLTIFLQEREKGPSHEGQRVLILHRSNWVRFAKHVPKTQPLSAMVMNTPYD
jgi:hypothetical protein